MGRLLESMRWTFKNDFSEPFLELVLLIVVYLVAVEPAIHVGDISARFSNLSWTTIYPMIFLTGIGGIRSFSLAAERGELARQLIDQKLTRTLFLASKFLSFYVLTFVPLLMVDLVAYLEFKGYFFHLPYTQLGTDFTLFFLVALLGQALLLFFLDSLVLALSVFLRKTTVVLLVFFAITILGVSLYVTNPPISLKYLQLGYGDFLITNDLAGYLEYVLTFGFSGLHLPVLTQAFFFGVIYRVVGGVLLFMASILWFRRMDLD
jgi:hypothetical protein